MTIDNMILDEKPRVPLGGDYWEADPGVPCGVLPTCTHT